MVGWMVSICCAMKKNVYTYLYTVNVKYSVINKDFSKKKQNYPVLGSSNKNHKWRC